MASYVTTFFISDVSKEIQKKMEIHKNENINIKNVSSL